MRMPRDAQETRRQGNRGPAEMQQGKMGGGGPRTPEVTPGRDNVMPQATALGRRREQGSEGKAQRCEMDQRLHTWRQVQVGSRWT